MIQQRFISLEDRVSWTKALEALPHAFAHTWENCYSMHLTSQYPTYLYCFEENDNRIVCPLAERTFHGFLDAVTPYGFSGFTGTGFVSEFPAVWNQYMKEREYVCSFITLNPILNNESY